MAFHWMKNCLYNINTNSWKLLFLGILVETTHFNLKRVFKPLCLYNQSTLGFFPLYEEKSFPCLLLLFLIIVSSKTKNLGISLQFVEFMWRNFCQNVSERNTLILISTTARTINKVFVDSESFSLDYLIISMIYGAKKKRESCNFTHFL